MADRNTKRLKTSVLQDDLDTFAALKDIGDYAPANPAFTLALAQAAKDAMQDGQTSEVQANAAAAAARDTATAGEWAFHDMMLGAKIQIKAQYGDSSDQLQAVGLKKKSEYKNPTRKPKP